MQNPIIKNLSTRMPDRLAIWSEFGELTAKYKAYAAHNGAPGISVPPFIAEKLAKAVDDGFNQYTITQGHPYFRKKIVEYYSKRFNHPLTINEVVVSNGANGTLCSATHGLVSPGEEIVTLEPFFPQYFQHSVSLGAKMNPVPLRLKQNEAGEKTWKLDIEEFKKAFTPKTKLFVFNNPHNPTGKLFTKEEMLEITKVLQDNPNVAVLSDEVYDFLTFDGKEHILFANLEDNWNRTLSVFSGGKLFSATGWKLGWGIGPKELVRQAVLWQETWMYNSNVPGQIAFANSFDDTLLPYHGYPTYLDYLRGEFEKTRDIYYNLIKESKLPIEPIKPDGGYFMMVDLSGIKDQVPEKYFTPDFEEDKENAVNSYKFEGKVPLDYAVCRWLCIEKGITIMPVSTFYYEGSENTEEIFGRIGIAMTPEYASKAAEKLPKE